MDKLKQTFNRNKDTEAEEPPAAGATGKVTGQGSHFSSAKTMDRDTLGATVAAQQDAGVAGTAADPNAAQGTTGPEAGGTQHVGTVNPSQVSEPTSAVGQTSTYSTHRLATGDPTPSVVDSRSTDPTTFKKPESNVAGTTSTSDVGVPPGAAEIAASRAFSGTHGEGMPGAYPGDKYENPYKAENLDPRVDTLPIRSKTDAKSGAATAAAASATTPDSRGNTEPATAQQQSSSGFVSKALAAVGLGGAAGAAGYAATRDEKDSAIGDSALPADATPKPTHGRKESIPTTAYPAGVDSPQAINPPIGGTTQGTEAPRAAEESHTGRNVALGAAGLGAAGAAGYGASQYASRNETDPSTFSPASATTLGRDNTDKLRDDLANQPTGISSSAKASANDPSTFAPATATTLGQDNTGKLRDDLASQPTGITQAAKDAATPASAAPATSSVLPLTEESEKEDHSKRNAALAAGGVGAAVGGAGACAATRGDSQAKATEPFGHTAIYGSSNTPTTYQPSAAPAHTATTSTTGQSTAVGAETQRKEDEDHTGRNAALAGAAGAGLVGAGAYGAHESGKKAAEEEAARHAAAAEKERVAAEKSRADADKAHQKELEKQEKAAAKDEKKHAKETEKAQKEAEKEAEKAQKEAEKKAKKEEKEHQKEVAALEKQKTKEEEQRRKEEEEEEKRKKAAAAAGVGAVGAGASAYAYERSKDDELSTKSPAKSEEKEKKPGLFKRIFKRRKNKDTGESEDYSSEEEDKDDSHKGALAGTAAGAGVAGAGAYAAHEHRDDKLDRAPDPSSQDIGVARSTDEPATSYEAASGGLVKPSYNPLAKDDPAHQQQQQQQHTSDTTTTTSPTAAAAAAATTTGTATHQAQPLQYDNQRAEPTDGSTSTDNRPVEPTTGLPYTPSKDREAAQRLSEHDANTPAEARRTSGGGEFDDNNNNYSGEPGSPTSAKKGLRQKLKEKITGHREEDEGGHGAHEQHSVLHKKPHQVPEDVRKSMEGSGN